MSEGRRVEPGCNCGRREFLKAGAGASAGFVAAALAAAAGEPQGPPDVAPFEWGEATIADLGRAMDEGRLTSRALVAGYLARIEAVDRGGPRLNAVIETNPEALALADVLDAERKAKGPRGPLHGIPLLIKDNIDTADRMRTSAGSLALAGSIAPRDATCAARLREAGAVLLGKTNLSEWANFRSTRSTSGWSGRGGQTKNPYVLDRNPCGSSSGTGGRIAAGLAAAGVGTETDGSIVCPSGINGLVGFKPTVGLVSRAGIIPISATQDTAGPMARCVADAALLLAALAGPPDPRDPATGATRGREALAAKDLLDPAALRGARIGVARNLFNAGPFAEKLAADALAGLKAAGAELIDPVELAHAGEYDDAETEVMLYEFKAGLEAYLAALAPSVPYRTLADLIRFNDENAAREMPFFGQEQFIAAQKKGPLSEPAYRKALARCRSLSREKGLDALFEKHRLDAIVAPTNGPAWPTDHVNGDHYTGGNSSPAAVAGYPTVTVPIGLVFGLPVGLTFTGLAWREAHLLRYAYAFEQATRLRKPPTFRPTLQLVP